MRPLLTPATGWRRTTQVSVVAGWRRLVFPSTLHTEVTWTLTHAHSAAPRSCLRRPTCSPVTQTLLFLFLKPTTYGSTKCEQSGAACILNCVCLCTKIASELVINAPYSWSLHQALLRAKMVLLIPRVSEEALLMLLLVLAIQMKAIIVWGGGGCFVGVLNYSHDCVARNEQSSPVLASQGQQQKHF